MPKAFNFSASPFDCLSAEEQRLVRDNVDIGYFAAGETVLDLGAAPSHLFVLIKGYVTQYEGDEAVASYGPDDCFDGRGLVAGKTSSRFVAAEEVLVYQLAKHAVSALIASNATFSALLFSDLGHKLKTLAKRRSEHEIESLAMARVDAALMRTPEWVDYATSVLEVVQIFQARNTSSVLVRDGRTRPERHGIFTYAALQNAILSGTALAQLPVGQFANFDLVSVQASDQIGDALTLMLRRRVHRVVVYQGDAIAGVVESLDLFSFLSNHSHLISVKIETAPDLECLAQAAQKISRMVSVLYRGGTRVEWIAHLAQELNAQLFQRAWSMIAPPELVAHSCLIVMGSEGRGEQLLKTDQDNGLILRDGYSPPADLEQICNRFSQALADFGYPPCPGNIMLSNAAWRKSAADFCRTARQWLLLPEPESLMNLAIFMDAHAVAGDAGLLAQVRGELHALSVDNDRVVAQFASAIDAFGGNHGWWSRLRHGDDDKRINIKKEGIFALVHGVRSLAFAAQVQETSTAKRLDALVALGVLSADQSTSLVQCLHFLMGLKLQAGLAELDTGRAVSGDIAVDKLSSLDRDLLKDSLEVVKRFKADLRHRFKLDGL